MASEQVLDHLPQRQQVGRRVEALVGPEVCDDDILAGRDVEELTAEPALEEVALGRHSVPLLRDMRHPGRPRRSSCLRARERAWQPLLDRKVSLPCVRAAGSEAQHAQMTYRREAGAADPPRGTMPRLMGCSSGAGLEVLHQRLRHALEVIVEREQAQAVLGGRGGDP